MDLRSTGTVTFPVTVPDGKASGGYPIEVTVTSTGAWPARLRLEMQGQ